MAFTVADLKRFVETLTECQMPDDMVVKAIVRGNVKDIESTAPWSAAAGGNPVIYVGK